MQIVTRETVEITTNLQHETVLEINFTQQDKAKIIEAIIEEDGMETFIEALDMKELKEISEHYKTLEEN